MRFGQHLFVVINVLQNLQHGADLKGIVRKATSGHVA